MTIQTTLSSDIFAQRQKENERTLLSMIIAGREQQKGHIMEHVCSEMFVDKTNIEIFEMIQDQYKMHGIGKLDADNLINDYKGKKYKNAVFEALLTLNQEYTTDVNCNYYINLLQKSWSDRMAKNCNSIEDFKAFEEQQKKYELVTKKTLSRINDMEDIATMGDLYDKRKNTIKMKTGFYSIDKLLGNIQGGDFIVMAGATGMGKTCVMLNFATSMAKQGLNILLFSLEMNKEQLLNRIISAETGIFANKFRNNNFTEQEEAQYFGYMYSDALDKLNIQTCTEYKITVDRIRNIALSAKCDVIFIDYLGLISSTNKQSSYERVSEISRELKLLAMELDKPIICLHQLSRAADARTDKRPLLSDLRDSGKIEQDADSIIFVFRPAYYFQEGSKNEMQIIIAKNRHSSTGSAEVNYNPYIQKITDMTNMDKWRKQNAKQMAIETF